MGQNISNPFLKLIDKAYIRKALKNTLKGKQKRGTLKTIWENQEVYVTELQKQLMEGIYDPATPKAYRIKDKKKTRVMYLTPIYPDRVVQRLLADILTPILRKHLIRDTYQSIEGKGVHSCIKRLKRWIMEHYKGYDYRYEETRQDERLYYLQLDVRQFYPSIDAAVLKQKLDSYVYDKSFLAFVFKFIDKYDGVYLGSSLSQILANFYLSELDHYIKERLKCKHYVRYCDDLIILHTDKNYLHYVREQITAEISRLNMQVKPYKLNPLETGLDFLGFKIYPYYTKIRHSIKNSLFRAQRGGSAQQIASLRGWALLCNDKGKGILAS